MEQEANTSNLKTFPEELLNRRQNITNVIKGTYQTQYFHVHARDTGSKFTQYYFCIFGWAVSTGSYQNPPSQVKLITVDFSYTEKKIELLFPFLQKDYIKLKRLTD